jgi:hypothetical protein
LRWPVEPSPLLFYLYIISAAFARKFAAHIPEHPTIRWYGYVWRYFGYIPGKPEFAVVSALCIAPLPSRYLVIRPNLCQPRLA